MPLSKTFPVTCHTDHVGPGSTFVAIKGMHEDGIQHIEKALSLGATTIVVQEGAILSDGQLLAIKCANAQLLKTKNTRKSLAELSAQAFDYPARKLKIIGITGTKGKSTTAFLTEHLLKKTGYKTALLSTIKNRILDHELPASLTTPQPDYLCVFFKACVDQNIDYVIMEVAAQAVTLYRVDGILFDTLIFTNFSKEHGEFYPTMNEYFQAKADLFKQLRQYGRVFLNQDDARVWSLSGAYKGALGFGLRTPAFYRAQAITNDLEGIQASIFCGEQNLGSVHARQLAGEFNLYNMLAATAVALAKGCPWQLIYQAIADFPGAPGRLQRFELSNGATAFIDYAHNPSSFQAVLSCLKQLKKKLVVVFGAGGDRDREKRPLMGAIACQFSDVVILTSDNPRSEDPLVICQEIKTGVANADAHKVMTELDRETAIRKAYQLSDADTIIALLGKGPDEYQLIKGVKTYFSEAALLKSF